jgi:hypothetical protein
MESDRFSPPAEAGGGQEGAAEAAPSGRLCFESEVEECDDLRRDDCLGHDQSPFMRVVSHARDEHRHAPSETDGSLMRPRTSRLASEVQERDDLGRDTCFGHDQFLLDWVEDNTPNHSACTTDHR